MHDHFVHLTNYSLNKQNENFNEQVHKLKVSDCLRGQMSQTGSKGRSTKSADELWQEIELIVVKTVLAVQPHL
jgi:hypothetical protein